MDASNEKAAPSEYLYLQKLSYDRSLEKKWFSFFVQNTRLTILLVIILFISGIFAFFNLPRESAPEVKIPIGVVVTVLHGANPADVEELVTRKLEKPIATISGVNQISSLSQESVSTISVEFDRDEDLDDAIRRLRDRVAEVKTELPEEAEEPQVSQVRFEDQAIWIVGLTGPYDGFSLRQFASTAKDVLEKVPNVSKVEIAGGDEAELEIAYDPEKLAQYNLSVESVNQAVKAANITFPLGTFKIGDFNYVLRVNSQITDARELRNLPIDNGNQQIYLRDVAMVLEKGIKRDSLTRFSVDQKRTESAVLLSVFKRPGGSIIEIVNKGEEEIASLQKTSLPSNVTFQTALDLSKEIEEDFDRLSDDAILTFSLVSLTLFLIIGLREALIASLAVPLVFAVSFIALYLLGMSLNFLSLFSLILSLGLLVDDAIVVVSATNKYFRSGKFTPEEGVILVLNDFKGVLLTTTLTTVWAFAPLIFSTGILGEFIKSIPITVSITLLASLAIAISVNHPLAAVLERLRPVRVWFYLAFSLFIIFSFGTTFFLVTRFGISQLGYLPFLVLIVVLVINFYRIYLRQKLISQEKLLAAERKDPQVIKEKLSKVTADKRSLLSRFTSGILRFDPILPYYDRFLRFLFRYTKWRRLTLAGIILLFIGALAMPALKLLPLEFFPSIDQDLMFVTIEGPANWTLDRTNSVTQKVENILLNEPAIENFSVVVGAAPIEQAQFVTFGAESNRANFTINLKERNIRELTSQKLAKKLRNQFATIRQAKVSVEEVTGGPPAGSAFTAEISGTSLQTLEKIALDFKSILEGINGTVNQDISIRHAAGQFTIHLDQTKLSAYNLNAAIVASTLRTAISGSEVTKILRDSKDIQVITRFNQDKIPTLDQLRNTQIINFAGQPVFLSSIADVKLEDSLVTINRTNQKRTVTVTADAQDVSASQILTDFRDRTKDYQLPSGYEIAFGGINEEFQESVNSILRSMVIALSLIIFTLIIQFNSFRKVLIVLVTIPLAVSGAFYGLTVARIALSFPGLIGVLALFGIVVKNAIILVDKINLNINIGIGFVDSIIDAAKSRLEAIFLTSFATILGVLPITLSNPLWLALGSALISGLALSTFLTLLVVPILYYILVPSEEEEIKKETIAKTKPPISPEPKTPFKIQGTLWQHP